MSTGLTRDIGQTERALRALLDVQFEPAGLSFPEWTALSFVEAAGSLTRGEILQRQAAGRVASGADAAAALDRLELAGLVRIGQQPGKHDPSMSPDARLELTADGLDTYRSVRDAVRRTTGDLYDGLDPADLMATHRTLNEIHAARRRG